MVSQLERLLTAVLLDPEVCAQTLAEQLALAPTDLAAAVTQARIVMANRGRQPDELQPFLADGDPVMALTVNERIELALSLRVNMPAKAIGELLKQSESSVQKQIRTARRELARAAIAMGLLTNPTKCPVMQIYQSEGQVLKRGRALHLVSHAAECQICVEVMRVIDRQIAVDYSQATMQLPTLPSVDVDQLKIARAAQPEISARSWSSSSWQSTTRLLRMAFWFGLASSVLLLIAVLLH